MEKVSGIYKLSIGKYIYIGQSINVINRVKQHKYQLKNNRHRNKYMQNVFNKYKTFEYKVLFRAEKQLLTVLEQVCMNYYDKELLLNSAAAEQLIRTESWKKAISVAHKTSTKAKAAREKLYEKRRKEGLSPEHYKNVCIANSKRRGVEHTQETKNKMSITRRNDPKHIERTRQLGLSMAGENNPRYQHQEYIFTNIKINDVFEGTRVHFRNYLNKSSRYNGNLTKLINGKQKTFFGYELTACKLPYQGIDK